jgi:hypothetical protein
VELDPNYHEAFWAVAGAAAPAIAIAAAVALPDTSQLVNEADERSFSLASDEKRSREALRLADRAMFVGISTQLNILIQAAILVVSLASLARGQDVLDTGTVVVLAGIGILLVAFTVQMAGGIRRNLVKLSKRPPR